MNNDSLSSLSGDSGLPVDRHSFDSSASSPKRDFSLDTVDADEATQLPEPIRDIADPLATAAPALGQFTLHIDPRQTRHMRYFQTFALAEEMMHGRRHRFGLSRSSHLFKLRSIQALYRFIDGEWSAERAGKAIGQNDLYAEQIYAKREPFLETVDKYLCQSVMSEAGYLKPHVDGFIETFPNSNRETVEHRFDRVKQVFGELAREEQPDVYHRLADIEASYNRRVAEAVADAALDVPYLIAPLDQRGFASATLSELDLKARFDIAADAVEDELVEENTDATPIELRQKIEGAMSQHVPIASDVEHPRKLDLPLLDVPQSVDTNETVRNKYEAIMEAPTELGRILNAAFRFTGNFGGAVYKYPDDTGELQLNWYINPLVADTDISNRLNRVRDAETYAELWEWMYVGNYLIEQLIEFRSVPEPPSVSCPLCFLTASGACGGTSCAVDTVVESVEANKHTLIKHIRHGRGEEV